MIDFDHFYHFRSKSIITHGSEVDFLADDAGAVVHNTSHLVGHYTAADMQIK